MVISSILIGGFPLWAYNIFKACVGSDAVSDLYCALKRAHKTPDRHYHTWRHTLNVVRDVASYRGRLESRRAALIAAFYHDSVYVPGAPDNEALSAEFAAGELAGLLKMPVLQRAQDYILATREHGETQDSSLAVLLDADMAILSSPWETYTRYARAIRMEFQNFSEGEYIRGRTAFLAKTMGHRAIYQAWWLPMNKDLERSARDNMAREIRSLARGEML